MKLFKKAKAVFDRLTGNDHDGPPPVRPDPTPETTSLLPVFFEKLPKYQQDQRDFKTRAKAVTIISTGTRKLGNNAAKRRNAADIRKLHGVKGGWKKALRLQGILLGAA